METKAAYEEDDLSVNAIYEVEVSGSCLDAVNNFYFHNPEKLGRSNGTHDFTLRTYKASELMVGRGRGRRERFGATHVGNLEIYTTKQGFKKKGLISIFGYSQKSRQHKGRE
eukprot:scaffold24417_cov127-Cylindrotheca_fusiformis.AAC.1